MCLISNLYQRVCVLESWLNRKCMVVSGFIIIISIYTLMEVKVNWRYHVTLHMNFNYLLFHRLGHLWKCEAKIKQVSNKWDYTNEIFISVVLIVCLVTSSGNSYLFIRNSFIYSFIYLFVYLNLIFVVVLLISVDWLCAEIKILVWYNEGKYLA